MGKFFSDLQRRKIAALNMQQRTILLISGCFIFALLACKNSALRSNANANPLPRILKTLGADSILNNPGTYEVQIIYTQIERDAQQKPHFTSWHWNVDSTKYFYPASMVKMPLAFLALEKINNLRASGYPRMNKDVFYQLDSLRPYQRAWVTDSTAPHQKPSIAQDIRTIFAVSDNEAYNHLFDFLGRSYINETLQLKGYNRTGIVHRFYAAKRDQRYAQPISFYSPTVGIFKEGEKTDKKDWHNPQIGLSKGKGYIGTNDQLIQEPFDFSTKNWFALTDMERMLRSVIFPDAMPAQGKFNFTKEDYRFLHRSMGLFPDEFDYPKYNPKDYWDGYAKFLVMGAEKTPQSGNIRIFNKIGEAYGTLTDVAYIVDFEHNVEFILAATILCNPDGVYNDDQYSYEQTGLPFLAKLGQAVLRYEVQRSRKVEPNLDYWQGVILNP